MLRETDSHSVTFVAYNPAADLTRQDLTAGIDLEMQMYRAYGGPQLSPLHLQEDAAYVDITYRTLAYDARCGHTDAYGHILTWVETAFQRIDSL